jgi:NADH:ubiquinone oxidoreductase subunit 6 (subunit J)
VKVVIIIVLLGIVGALASAGALMLRKGRRQDEADSSMARALALRVALSIALFLFVLLAWKLGWIAPTGVPLAR